MKTLNKNINDVLVGHNITRNITKPNGNPCSSISIVDFEQVNTDWVYMLILLL